MLEKGFIKDRKKKQTGVNRIISTIAGLLFFLGILSVIAGLIFMILNLSKADAIYTVWIYFMVTGIIMVFIGQMLKKQNSGSSRR